MSRDVEQAGGYAEAISLLDEAAAVAAVRPEVELGDKPDRRAALEAAQEQARDQFEDLVKSNGQEYFRVLAGLAVLGTGAKVSSRSIEYTVSWERTLPGPEGEEPGLARISVGVPSHIPWDARWDELLAKLDRGQRIPRRRQLGLAGLDAEQTRAELTRRAVKEALERGTSIAYKISDEGRTRSGTVVEDKLSPHLSYGDLFKEHELIGRALDTDEPPENVAARMFEGRMRRSRVLQTRMAAVAALAQAMATEQ